MASPIVSVPIEAQALVRHRDPEQILAEAKKAADVLMRVYNSKPEKDKVKMNGRNYLEYDDWNTLARFFNVTTQTKSTNYVEFGGVHGFEAIAEAVIIMDGQPVVLSKADAMCLNDEENWGTRAKYEWKDVLENGQKVWEDNPNKPGSKRAKRERTKVGDEAVPLFQLRSMAQTRAQAKALRQLFSWVLVLAELHGIAGTPGEEVKDTSTVEEEGVGTGEIGQPKKSAAPTGTPISDGQRKRMYAMARDAGYKDAEARVKEVLAAFHIEKDTHVPKGDVYNAVIDAITNKNWKASDVKTAEPAAAAAPKSKGPDKQPYPVETTISDAKQGKDSKGDFVELHDAGGFTFYGRNAGLFADLAASVGKPVKFIAQELAPNKYGILNVLQVGDKEWLEDGTPVIRREKVEAEAQQAPVDTGIAPSASELFPGQK